jgi:phage terminase small subunit
MAKQGTEPKTKSGRYDRDGLTQREQLFVWHYLSNGGNGLRAARAAGYTCNAAHRAVELLRRSRIAVVIERERARMLQKLDVTAERVLLELGRVAFFNPIGLFRADNSMIPISELDRDTAAAIAAVAQTRSGGMRIKFHNKVAALQLLGSYLKLWDGAGDSRGDRLSEIVRAIHESPTETIQ